MPKKAGRPPADPSGTRHKVMSFRPTSDVKEWLDGQVASGQAHSIATAIIDAIREVQRRDKDKQDELERTFGGTHNLNLALMVARIANGIEHETQVSWWSQEKGVNGKLFFLILYTVMLVLRDFARDSSRKATAYYDSFFQKHGYDAPRILTPCLEIASKIRKNLNNPEKTWWPLGDAVSDSLAHPKKMADFFASLPRTEDPTESLVDPFRESQLEFEAKEFEAWIGQGNVFHAERWQSWMIEHGYQPEQMTQEEFMGALDEAVQADIDAINATDKSVEDKAKKKEAIETVSDPWRQFLEKRAALHAQKAESEWWKIAEKHEARAIH